MEEFASILPRIPTAVPQWGIFIILLGLAVKQIVPWRQVTLDSRDKFCKTLTEQMDLLQKKLTKCEEDCAKSSKELHEELFGMRKQNIQEQISLINTIMRSVDAPELKSMSMLLERVQQNLQISQHREQEHDAQRS